MDGLWTCVLLLFAPSLCLGGNMIPGNYLLANSYPGYEIGKYRGDYFELYSYPISTQYSQVYWHLQPLVPLPDKIIQQFNGSVMAVTGYEVDIVRKDPNGGPDIPVPSYEQYNHHYALWLLDNTSVEVNDANAHDHFEASKESRYRAKPGARAGDTSIPLIQYFSEGNGGEMRLSFHGYPKGTAQLVDSPNAMKIIPMMINTKNPAGGRGGPLPISNNIWPSDAPASGLIECPCTTRIKKTPAAPISQNSGICSTKNYTAAQDCFNAAVTYGIKASANQTQSNSTMPGGCTFRTGSDGTTSVTFNTLTASSVPCGSSSPLSNATGQTQSINNLKLELNGKESSVTITIAGKDGVWFGVGFNASLMADQPYAIIVDGYGKVSERKLAEHDPGVQLDDSVTLLSSDAVNGIRTVVVTRPLVGKDARYYTFSFQSSSINFINAVGSTPDLSYHFNRTGSVINLAISDADVCLCPGHGGSVNGLPFGENCKPEPTSDLLVQNNPTCFWETFNGGLQCCYDGDFLLDAEQEIPPAVDTYYMKMRWYYETYNPTTVSHRNLVHIYWQTEAWQGEYDVMQCPQGTPSQECVHTITSHFSLRDLASGSCDERHNPDCIDINQVGDKGMNLIYAAAHCHAPMCIDLELYDQSTGTLLCRNYPVWGKSDKVYDESGYISGIPPCEWGSADEGLPPPPVLYLDTPLLSIKRANATYKHYGDMASWQMRGAYIN